MELQYVEQDRGFVLETFFFFKLKTFKDLVRGK